MTASIIKHLLCSVALSTLPPLSLLTDLQILAKGLLFPPQNVASPTAVASGSCGAERHPCLGVLPPLSPNPAGLCVWKGFEGWGVPGAHTGSAKLTPSL